MEQLSALPEPVKLASTAVVGFFVLRFCFEVLSSIYAFTLRPGKNLKKFGEWAVVTGATDGIGEAMAVEMARKGMNIILISRTESKLQASKEKIVKKCPKVQVEYLPIDFSNFDTAAQNKVKAMIADKDVGVLVNNVGVSYSFCRYYHELTMEEVDNMVELNVNSTGRMTYIVLEGMIARKRGAIVNMSSSAARNPTPLLVQYSGTKGYVEHFTESLNVELAGKGIHVQVQSPLFVATKLAKIKRASLTVASPAGYARAAVAHIGYETKVSPFWSHALQLALLRSLPDWLRNSIVMSMHQTIRKKGFKKLQQKKD